jgi:uncharacterized protein (TIRG00374 family)
VARWLLFDRGATAQRIRWLFRLMVLGLLLGALFWLVPFGEVVAAITAADPRYVLAGFLIVLPAIYMDSTQFKLMTDRQGMNLSVLEITLINLAVRFYQLFIPATWAGSGLRWYRFSRAGNKPAEALAALTFDRVTSIFLAVALGIGFWLVSVRGDNLQGQTHLFAFLLVSVVTAWFMLPGLSRLIYDWLERTAAFWKQTRPTGFLHDKAGKVFLAFASYQGLSHLLMFQLVALGMGGQLLGMVSYWYLALAVSVDLSLSEMGWIRSVILLSAFLPVNFTPGLGVREFGLVAILAAMGFPLDKAVAVSGLIFGRTFAYSLLGGLVELVTLIRRRR